MEAGSQLDAQHGMLDREMHSCARPDGQAWPRTLSITWQAYGRARGCKFGTYHSTDGHVLVFMATRAGWMRGAYIRQAATLSVKVEVTSATQHA